MRITLAQWRDKYGFPTTPGGNIVTAKCRFVTCEIWSPASVELCSYHEGFVDGFDAARGGG